MNRGITKDVDKIFAEGAEIDKALVKAVHRALLQHKRAGNPVATWRDGKVVWIPAEEIEIEEGVGDRKT